MTGRRVASLIPLLVAFACDAPGPPTAHRALGSDWTALQNAFDADRGHHRVVMLASPT